MDSYPYRLVENKQRKRWEAEGVNKVDMANALRKLYVLVMFSYPSEKKLHIGHWWNYGPTDTFARFKRMQGFNVFEPMGFDAFGLPAENYAIKHGVHPGATTRDSVKHIREQLKQIGAMYDWNYEVDTSTPEYYRWTQWLFLQLYKAGSAYLKQSPVNWCPNCQTVLANEQVKTDGSCDRCGEIVTTRDLEQWFFRITDFADRLLDGLDRLDWPEPTKAMQRNWIGRSEGTEIEFSMVNHPFKIKCFTTRADTLCGVTYIVLAPEHPLLNSITTSEQHAEVESYVKRARDVSEIDRQSTEREKSGVFTGAYALNPVTGQKVPVWSADYVIGSYGTGAVMAVPAHDQRDFEFAKKYGLPLKWVIKPMNPHDDIFTNRAFEEYGVMHASGEFDGLTSMLGKEAVTKWLEENKAGKATVSFRLRDWSISRQRYWGAPIPVIHCPKCGITPVPEKDLPVMLPEDVKDYKPRGTSPLGAHEAFMNVDCPACGSPARRDPDTMDTFVDSSWYYLRYPSARRDDAPFDKELTEKWLPVDVYVGGPEHATGHLIYSRFIAKFLHSQGWLSFDEPFTRMIHQGIITHQGQRMSKSKGNVVNPDAFVEKYGSDCFRLYLMFMGDYTVGGDWSDEGIVGVRRFQNRIWRLFEKWAPEIVSATSDNVVKDRDLNRILNYTVQQVTRDLDQFQFNTAISRLMELNNALYQYTSKPEIVDRVFMKEALGVLARLVGPVAPYMSEELWTMLGGSGSIFAQPWPVCDIAALGVVTVTLAVQLNGKLIETVEITKGATAADAETNARESLKVTRHLAGKNVRKVIYVQDRILNFVA